MSENKSIITALTTLFKHTFDYCHEQKFDLKPAFTESKIQKLVKLSKNEPLLKSVMEMICPKTQLEVYKTNLKSEASKKRDLNEDQYFRLKHTSIKEADLMLDTSIAVLKTCNKLSEAKGKRDKSPLKN